MAKKIIVFACENSALKAIEGVTDPGVLGAIEIVRLPCSGKIEIGLLLKCLEEDYPGVLVLACPIDNCKYLRGNRRARHRVEMARQALKGAGISEERVHIDYISSVESHKVAELVRGMQQRLIVGTASAAGTASAEGAGAAPPASS
ncbi:MAG: hydrogenase iron-sulfur subunit [Spirochaetales bacterium]|nr:hydrogenase iron-sulfur subunit [Spirochaetales bacterium]